MRLLPVVFAAAIGLVTLGAASEGLAQSNVVARATLYKDLQFGFPYAIRLYDDTRLGRLAHRSLEEELDRQGVLIDPQSVLRIDLAVERISAAFEESQGTLGRLGNSDRGLARGLELTMNIWSSRQDSLLGGRQRKTRSSSEPFVHINAIVRDNETREVLWQGDALAPISQADEESAALDAAEALARVFGKSGTYPEQ